MTLSLFSNLSNLIKSSISKIEDLIENYSHRNKYGTFYLDKGERIENMLVHHIATQLNKGNSTIHYLFFPFLI